MNKYIKSVYFLFLTCTSSYSMDVPKIDERSADEVFLSLLSDDQILLCQIPRELSAILVHYFNAPPIQLKVKKHLGVATEENVIKDMESYGLTTPSIAVLSAMFHDYLDNNLGSSGIQQIELALLLGYLNFDVLDDFFLGRDLKKYGSIQAAQERLTCRWPGGLSARENGVWLMRRSSTPLLSCAETIEVRAISTLKVDIANNKVEYGHIRIYHLPGLGYLCPALEPNKFQDKYCFSTLLQLLKAIDENKEIDLKKYLSDKNYRAHDCFGHFIGDFSVAQRQERQNDLRQRYGHLEL